MKTYALEQIESFVQKGKQLGLEIGDIEEKMNRIKSDSSTIKIVLLGSVSEGKTSTIAALLGMVKEDMKIDPAESSDEIIVYKTHGLDSNIEIIDTPGLFGTKEKEINGEMMKYSDITKKYITEAHLVLYVCNAVNPLKESHREALKLVLRDYGKLDSTIFVVNGMDGLGFDLTDKDEYLRNAKIKQNVVIDRLKLFIGLTPEEEKHLSIICVSADPKGKGLQYWMEDKNRAKYESRSNIQELKDATKNKLAVLDKTEVDEKILKATSLDIVKRLSDRTELISQPLNKNLKSIKSKLEDAQADSDIMKSELLQNKKNAKEQLIEYQSSIISDIEGASVDSFSKMLESSVGVEGKEVTGYIIESRTSTIIENCGQQAQHCLEMKAGEFQKNFDDMDKLAKKMMKQGANLLGKASVSGQQVLKFRDAFNISYKFKPWGAIKLGNKITKVLKNGGTVLSGLIEALNLLQTFKATDKVKKAKKALTANIQAYFSELLKMFNTDHSYYENFAPSYLDLCEIIKAQRDQISNMENTLNALTEYNESLKKWLLAENQENI